VDEIPESLAEFFAGLIIFVVAGVMLYTNLIGPIRANDAAQRIAQVNKSVTYSNTISTGSDAHDQKVGRIPGIDINNGYDKNDSGSSRMYFRPEQFVMLPAVDTDSSANPNVVAGKRTIAVSTSYNKTSPSSNPLDRWGWTIGVDSFQYFLSYTNSLNSISNKQLTYSSIPVSGVMTALTPLRGISNPAFGTQANGNNIAYGGFNLTIDSSVDNTTKKKSNSVILVAGRVPSK
jgi:hypothetical protein